MIHSAWCTTLHSATSSETLLVLAAECTKVFISIQNWMHWKEVGTLPVTNHRLYEFTIYLTEEVE